MVRHEPEGAEKTTSHQLVDVFNRGQYLTKDEATRLIARLTGRPVRKAAFETATNRSILVRMLVNLLDPQGNHKPDNPAARLRYLEALVTLEPTSVQWRGMRGVSRHQMGRKSGRTR